MRKLTAEDFIEGFTPHYKDFKPHEGLDGKVRAEAADVPLVFRGWREIAHLQDRMFQSPRRRERFKDRTFRLRRRMG